ncbi:MAG: helix-turn-helix transcriptional regulator, partial [Gammaproteobacteria bacterium]|nr:helix-turn-helix transcriptional regulator [Gammaproteobacteria bacterium]
MTPKDIGEVIRQTRKAQGLRQDQLAAAAGVGQRFLVELEAGKSTAQIGKALNVLAALGCSLTIKASNADTPRQGPCRS